MEIDTPEGLEALPIGTVINDSDLIAVKAEGGAWRYEHDGQHWEPEGFPVEVVSTSA